MLPVHRVDEAAAPTAQVSAGDPVPSDPTTPWDLTTGRSDLSDVRVDTAEPLEPRPGEALLRVEHVGVTANNVTYGLLGDAFGYWRFFPAAERGRGRVPLWGLASVVGAEVEGLAPGDRVYGFLPSSSHLLVRPGPVRDGSFSDQAGHRQGLAAVYNAYTRAPAADACVQQDESRPTRHDLQVVFRPLLTTSFLLADWLTTSEPVAAVVVLSSASSRTAYGTALLLRDVLRGTGAHVVGLTSPGHRAFTESLGVYDEVLAYEEARSLGAVPTTYVDVAGDPGLRRVLHERLGPSLVREVSVGLARGVPGQAAAPAQGLPRPVVFFAPDRVAQRRRDWGADGLAARLEEAWRLLVARADDWVAVRRGHGADGLRSAWERVLAGASPSEADVVHL